jgi:hypothetical protein
MALFIPRRSTPSVVQILTALNERRFLNIELENIGKEAVLT